MNGKKMDKKIKDRKMNEKKMDKRKIDDKKKKEKELTPKQNASGEWIYFAGEGTTVRSLMEALEGQDYKLELWEDAGVLEVGMKEGGTVDFEETRIHPKDEATAAFARENKCEEVFLVTFPPENYEKAEGVMEKILEKKGGVFCADNERMEPVIR